MDFKANYKDAIIQTRIDRAQRARFWARLVGIALMLTIGVVLRSEPELRTTLAVAGMDAIDQLRGQQPAPDQTASAEIVGAGGLAEKVRVNRPDTSAPNG